MQVSMFLMKLVQNPPVALFVLWVNTWLTSPAVFKLPHCWVKIHIAFHLSYASGHAFCIKLGRHSTLLKFKSVGY